MTVARSTVLLLALGPFSLAWAGEPTQTEPFPAILPLTKPAEEIFRPNNVHFSEQAYFQQGVALPPLIKQQLMRDRKTLDRETIR